MFGDPEDAKPGMTSSEYKEFRKVVRSPKGRESDEDSERRLEDFMAGGSGLLPKDYQNFLDGIAEMLGSTGGDSRDKAARKDFFKIAEGLVKRAQEVGKEDDIERDWDDFCEKVRLANAAEAENGTPEALRAMQERSDSHAQRVINREVPDAVAETTA